MKFHSDKPARRPPALYEDLHPAKAKELGVKVPRYTFKPGTVGARQRERLARQLAHIEKKKAKKAGLTQVAQPAAAPGLKTCPVCRQYLSVAQVAIGKCHVCGTPLE